MGKSKWDKMDPYDKMRAMNEIADFYGVEGHGPGSRGGGFGGRPGMNSGGGGRDTSVRRFDNDHERMQRQINDAMANGATADYLRYSGNRDLPHANDREGMYDLFRQMKKEHKKSSGGAFNNQSDVYGLSQQAFGDWEQNLLDKIDDGKGDNDDPKPVQTPKSSNMSWNQAVESGSLSQRVLDAIERQESGDYGTYLGASLNTKKATENTPTETPASAAQSFLKNQVISTAQDKEKIEKSKQTEKVYGGLSGFASGDLHRTLYGTMGSSGSSSGSSSGGSESKVYGGLSGFASGDLHRTLYGTM